MTKQSKKGILEAIGKPSGKTVAYVVFAMMVIYSLAPFVWLITSVFHPRAEIWIEIPEEPTLDNIITIFTKFETVRWMLNSLIIAAGVIAIAAVVAGLAGYSLSRLDFRGKNIFMAALLLTGVMPGMTKLIPLYKIVISLGLRNTLLGVIFVIAAGGLPGWTWIIKGFFDSIPRELEEQSWIEGCTRLGSLFRIVFPLAGPGVAVIAILSFLSAWGNFTTPLILLTGIENYPISVGITACFREAGAGEAVIDYGALSAMTILYIIPVIILYAFVRKYLFRIRLARMEV